MPTFDVIVQGKKYHVEIPDPGASPLQVVVDGQAFDVEVSGAGVSAQTQLAEAPRPAPEPPALPPMPRVATARPTTPAPATAQAGAGHEVTAPMPGTLLSVAVKPGDAVEAGQVVCVLEAMKMKNPIRASFSGTVAAIPVTAGQTVAYGDVLVRLA